METFKFNKFMRKYRGYSYFSVRFEKLFYFSRLMSHIKYIFHKKYIFACTTFSIKGESDSFSEFLIIHFHSILFKFGEYVHCMTVYNI